MFKNRVNGYLVNSVGPYVISCQMFVKSEFPLDSALVCDSDQKKLGWHFFASSKVMKSKMDVGRTTWR